MGDFNVDTSSRFPIKAWTKGVQVEDVAVKQLRNIANMPFIHRHVAVIRMFTGAWERLSAPSSQRKSLRKFPLSSK